MEAKMSCEYTETIGVRNDALNMENLKIDRGHVLRREERLLKEAKMIFNRWMKMMIAIDGRDRASFHESSLPLDDRPIIDK